MNFVERYRQARLYASQVRVRKAMGDRYEHATPWRGPTSIKSNFMNFKTRRIESEHITN